MSQIIKGPRAIRNQKKYFQQALQEKEKEQELKTTQLERDTCCLYESTAAASQKYGTMKSIARTRSMGNNAKQSQDDYGDGEEQEQQPTTGVSFKTTSLGESGVNNEHNTNGQHNIHGELAITFWSHQLLTMNTSSCYTCTSDSIDRRDRLQEESKGGKNEYKNLIKEMKRKSFARCTSFTNDIRDGRLQHARH